MMLRLMERSSTSKGPSRGEYHDYDSLRSYGSGNERGSSRYGGGGGAGGGNRRKTIAGSTSSRYGAGSRHGSADMTPRYTADQNFGDDDNDDGVVQNLWTTVDITPHRQKLKKKFRHSRYRVVGELIGSMGKYLSLTVDKIERPRHLHHYV